MTNYSTAITIINNKELKDGLFNLKLRVTIDREARFYGLKYYMTKDQYQDIWVLKKRGNDNKKTRNELEAAKVKADQLLAKMDPPTFDQFRRLFTQKGDNGTNGDNVGNVEKYYLNYINELKQYDRYGTASSYECSLNSLKEIKGLTKVNFKHITVNWLKDYQHKAEKLGKSISTVGIYLRPLRSLYRQAIRDGIVSDKYYPFGSDSDRKFQIPSSQNNKRPLTRQEIQLLAEYGNNPIHEKYRDFFILSYYLSGLNFFDLLTMKWKQLQADKIEIVRAKTKRTTIRNQSAITVYLNDYALAIINQYGNKEGKYIFNVIADNDNAQVIRLKVQRFTRNTNQALKAIATAINTEAEKTILNPNISTVFARHSAASHGIQAGHSLPLISKMLGHTDLKTTSNYLSTLDSEAKQLAESLMIPKKVVPNQEHGTNITQSQQQ